jgi:hypothetical protein
MSASGMRAERNPKNESLKSRQIFAAMSVHG